MNAKAVQRGTESVHRLNHRRLGQDGQKFGTGEANRLLLNQQGFTQTQKHTGQGTGKRTQICAVQWKIQMQYSFTKYNAIKNTTIQHRKLTQQHEITDYGILYFLRDF